MLFLVQTTLVSGWTGTSGVGASAGLASAEPPSKQVGTQSPTVPEARHLQLVGQTPVPGMVSPTL